MTPEQLRRACEMAGLEWVQSNGTYRYTFRNEDGDLCVGSLIPPDPALVAFVASVLVADVMEKTNRKDIPLTMALMPIISDNQEISCATDKQRIIAAMAVLEAVA